MNTPQTQVEETIELEGVTVVAFEKWLHDACGRVARNNSGMPYRGGSLWGLDKRSPKTLSNGDYLYEVHILYTPPPDDPGGRDEHAIALQLAVPPDDNGNGNGKGSKITVTPKVEGSQEQGVIVLYDALREDAVRVLLASHSKTKKAVTVSEAGEVQPDNNLSEAEQIQLNYILGYPKSKYKNQAAYCDNVPVRAAQKGEVGRKDSPADGEGYIYIAQRTFAYWKNRYKAKGLLNEP